MKAFFGFLIVFGLGILTLLSISNILEVNGYTTVFITVVKVISIAIIVAIPPILIFSRNSEGGNRLESLGAPAAKIMLFVAEAYTTPTGGICLLLIVLINILLWK